MIVWLTLFFRWGERRSAMPSQMSSSIPCFAKRCRALLSTVPLLLILFTQQLSARNDETGDKASDVLTNIFRIWEMPQSERGKLYRIRTEAVIYYLDPEWGGGWGESCGRPTWLPVYDCPIPLRVGQRILIDGVVLPQRERFVWDKTKVQVLENDVPLRPELCRDLLANPAKLKGKLLSVEGLIDQQMEDPTHVTLNFLAERGSATVFVLKGTNGPSPHFKQGDYVRLKCVYSPRFDREGRLQDLALWVAQPSDVEVTGTVATDPRFATPITRMIDISEATPTNNMVHVIGSVRHQEPGKWLTLWDASGQIMVQSPQTQPLRFGDLAEAVGYAYVAGVQQCLHNGIYRTAVLTNNVPAAVVFPDTNSPFYLVERIQELGSIKPERRMPVSLRAVVTWSHEETPFAYVQDASGGIMVKDPKWETADALKPGTIVSVNGEICEGGFVPAITNAILAREGWSDLPQAQPTTLEQALTGNKVGRWIEMLGFVGKLDKTNGLVRMSLSSSGDLQGWVPVFPQFEKLNGCVVQVRGVCGALSNPRHQLTGIEIWIPDEKYIRILEAAPEDPYAVTARPLGDLRRFNLQNELGQRVRTSATALLQNKGRDLYVQDGADSAFVLTHQSDPVLPGDRVEIVGFCGNEGHRVVIREAVYRRISSGTNPVPIRLNSVMSMDLDLVGLLATAEGTLLNTTEKDGEVRLMIRRADGTFEVRFYSKPTSEFANQPIPPVGSLLKATGVYELQNDESGTPRSFLLQARSWNDLKVLKRAPWWTLGKLLWLLGAVLILSGIGLVWGLFISRKNLLLAQAKTELEVAHNKLERRVEERTKELAYERDLLEALLENLPDLIYFKDLDSRYVRVSKSKLLESDDHARNGAEANPGPEALSVKTANINHLTGFLAGKTDFDLYTAERARTTLREEEEIIKSGTPMVGKVEQTRLANGRFSWWLTTKMPWRDKTGQIIGTFGTSKDITPIKEAEAKLEEIHRKLLEASRQAGMSEIASSVLHNVGNVLNSVNVSANVVAELVQGSGVGQIAKLARLLEEEHDRHGGTIPDPEKLAQIIAYVKALANKLATQQTDVLKELQELTNNIQHIKEIVTTQQQYTRMAGVIEMQSIPVLIEDAVRMHADSLARYGVEVVRQFTKVPEIPLDKHRVLQILVNLISNAKHALRDSSPAQRTLTLGVHINGDKRMRVSVEDNGVGIAPENLTRIFAHGFTTKKNGHGFGLHSSALAARDMGGALHVESQGPGHGARFTLELPMSPDKSQPECPNQARNWEHIESAGELGKL